MARRQSAAIYFRGTRHKEIYYQGHYHDELWLNGQCLWKKLAGGFPTAVLLSALGDYSMIGKIGSTAYSLTCAKTMRAETLTLTMKPWTAGAAGTPVTVTRSSSTYSGARFYPASRAKGMLIAAVDVYRGRRMTDQVVFVSKDGETVTGYTLPAWSEESYPNPTFSRNGVSVDAGVLGDLILLPGKSTSTKCYSHFVLDTASGNSRVYSPDQSLYYDFCYYLGFYNDAISGDLYGLRVTAVYHSSSAMEITKIDLVQITAVAADGSLTVRSLCTLPGTTTDIMQYIHAVNGAHFDRSGPTLYKIDTTTGAASVVLTLPETSCCFVGDVCYSGTEYLALAWDPTAKTFAGYTSPDGVSWTQDATVTVSESISRSNAGNSIYADGGVYTAGWNQKLIYAAE